MSFEARHHYHLSQQTITNKREYVKIDQPTAVNINSVPVGIANPFATTMWNPWLGLNNLFLGSTNMVILPQTDSMNAENGLTNTVPNDGPRKRSREAMDNQFNKADIVPCNTINNPLQGFAAQIFANNMKSLLETELVLSQYSKKIKMEIAARKKQAPGILCDGDDAPWMKKLKENEEEILNVEKLNIALQERVKSLYSENQLWKDVGNIMESMARFQNANTTPAHVSNQGLPASCGVVADCEKNSGKNKQISGGKLVATAGDGGDVAGKGKNLAGATDVSSGYRMCKKCGERESCVLVLPCKHLCLCTVCAEANHQATCPGCNSLVKGTVLISLT